MENLRIEIEKGKRRLAVFDGDDLIRGFDVVFGSVPMGSKEIEGDGKTPEGEYLVWVKNPESKYHLSLCLNYPNLQDAERGLAAGSITSAEWDAILEAVQNGKLPPQGTALGGEIYIHGGGTDGNWTRGCVGLTDGEMTELFEMIEIGTKVTIRP